MLKLGVQNNVLCLFKCIFVVHSSHP